MKKMPFFETLGHEKLVATQHNSEDQNLQLQAKETSHLALLSLFGKLN